MSSQFKDRIQINKFFIPSISIIILQYRFPSMQSSSSSSDSDSSKKEDVNIKEKFITFRNPDEGKQIIAKVPIPRFIHLTRNQVHDLEALRNKLKLLYIDVLCRGYHPVKGFEAEARNVFKEVESSEKIYEKNIRITRLCNNEAVGTIWRCLGRQIGRPLKNYNLEEAQAQLIEELDLMKQRAIQSSKKVNRNQKSSKENLKQLVNLETQIRLQMQRLVEKSKKIELFSASHNDAIVRVLSEQILELEREIFVRSIVGIRQWQQNGRLVEILLEQCYPSIKMSQQIAVQVLGERLFNQKEQFYSSCREKYGLDAENQLICCHRCLIPLNSFGRLSACDDQCASLEVAYTLLTDPYLYNRAVINENCSPKAPTNFMHPYLIYYRTANDDSVAICNRYFCNKCEGMEPALYTAGHCNFCEGLCDCFRCQNMDLLTKMMAVFIDNSGDLQSLTNKFLMKFDTKTLKTKKKKRPGWQPCKQQQFEQHLQFFLKHKIFKKKQNGQHYEAIKYFNEKPNRPSAERVQKNRMAKVKLMEEKTDRQERKRKEWLAKEQIKRLNSIISGEDQKKRDKSVREQKHEAEKKFEPIDVYFEDSSS